MELAKIEISISSKWPLKFLRRPLYGPPLDAVLRFISCALFYPRESFSHRGIYFVYFIIFHVSSIEYFSKRML